jgi:hypothetical protein
MRQPIGRSSSSARMVCPGPPSPGRCGIIAGIGLPVLIAGRFVPPLSRRQTLGRPAAHRCGRPDNPTWPGRLNHGRAPRQTSDIGVEWCVHATRPAPGAARPAGGAGAGLRIGRVGTRVTPDQPRRRRPERTTAARTRRRRHVRTPVRTGEAGTAARPAAASSPPPDRPPAGMPARSAPGRPRRCRRTPAPRPARRPWRSNRRPPALR